MSMQNNFINVLIKLNTQITNNKREEKISHVARITCCENWHYRLDFDLITYVRNEAWSGSNAYSKNIKLHWSRTKLYSRHYNYHSLLIIELDRNILLNIQQCLVLLSQKHCRKALAWFYPLVNRFILYDMSSKRHHCTPLGFCSPAEVQKLHKVCANQCQRSAYTLANHKLNGKPLMSLLFKKRWFR